MKSLSVLGLLGASALVASHPHHGPKTSSLKKRTVDLNNFRLKSTAYYVKAYNVKADRAVAAFSKGDTYVETATALVKRVAPDAEFRVVEDHWVGDNGVAHINFKQTAHGLDIDNADFNVNVSCTADSVLVTGDGD